MKKSMIITAVALCAGMVWADVLVAQMRFNLTPAQMADGRLRGGSTPSGQADAVSRAYLTNLTEGYRDEPILVFVLPDLAGKAIGSANLSAYGATVLANATKNSGVDLYGIRYAANTAGTGDTEMSSADAATSYAFSVSGNNGTGIMDNFLPASTSATLDGTYSTDASADIALGSWLQSLYDSGAQAGDYAFLRLSSDSDAYQSRGWNVTMADNATNQPALTITTIPEPATIGILSLGSLMILIFRRMQV